VDAILETETPGLHLLPAHPDLSAVESELPARVNAELRLRNAMREGLDARYDLIIFDTPPNFGFHTISALGAARSALVPLQMSAFALRGLKEVIRVIAAARRHLNPELELLGVVPTFVNNTRFSRDMLEALGDVSQVRVFRSEIGLTVKLQESALQGVPVLVSAPSSTAARAYAALAAELVEVGAQRLAPAGRNGARRAAQAAPVVEDAEFEDQALPADAPVEPVEPIEPMASDDEGDAPEDEVLDDGYAVTLAGEASHGAVTLASAEGAARHLESQSARRPRVMLELELGHGAIAIADMPSVAMHAAGEHDGDELSGHADVEDDEEEAGDAAETEAVTEHRRRFRFFRRDKAS
jgi:chromosome partitioning protein